MVGSPVRMQGWPRFSKFRGDICMMHSRPAWVGGVEKHRLGVERVTGGQSVTQGWAAA